MRSPNHQRAVTMAYRCLLRFGNGQLPVKPLEMLRICRNTQVMTYAAARELLGSQGHLLNADHAEAMTFRFERDDHTLCYLVCYAEDGNPARLNYTLAHELGHLVMGHQSCDQADEAEADCFAAHLLCPRPILQQLRQLYHPLYAEQVAHTCFTSIATSLMMNQLKDCTVDQTLEAQVGQLFQEHVTLHAMAGNPSKPNWHPMMS